MIRAPEAHWQLKEDEHAHVEIPMNHKTQQIPRTTKKTAKQQNRSGDNELNWDEHTIHTYQSTPGTSLQHDHPQHDDQPHHSRECYNHAERATPTRSSTRQRRRHPNTNTNTNTRTSASNTKTQRGRSRCKNSTTPSTNFKEEKRQTREESSLR